MPQRVRGDLGAEAGVTDGGAEALGHARDRLALPFDGVALARLFPAPQMGDEARRQRDRWLAFIGLHHAARNEHAAFGIDPAAAWHRLQRGLDDGAGAAAGVEADEDEAGEMTAGVSRGGVAALPFAMVPAMAHQRGCLGSGQPRLARRPPRWQRHLDQLADVPLAMIVIDGGAQVLQFAPGGGVGCARAA